MVKTYTVHAPTQGEEQTKEKNSEQCLSIE